jgi:CshA-type fibril repeat protein
VDGGQPGQRDVRAPELSRLHVNDPTPIPYTVSDLTNLESNQATITIDYVPVATNDTSTGNTTGTPVTVDVLDNDTTGDTVDPTTVQIVGTANPGDPLVVDGEGTWSVDPVTGAITFTPEAGYTGDPAPIQYTVDDDEGNTSDPATVTVEYNQFAAGGGQRPIAGQPAGRGDAERDGQRQRPEQRFGPQHGGIVDHEPHPASDPLVVGGEGTWTVDSLPAT